MESPLLTPTGRVTLSVSGLQIAFTSPPVDLPLPAHRIDAELIGLEWATGQSSSITGSATLNNDIAEFDMEIHAITVAFPLDKVSVSRLSNAMLKLTVQSVSNAAAPAASKSKSQTEQAHILQHVFELLVPLSSLVLAPGCLLTSFASLDSYNSSLLTSKPTIDLARRTLQWTLAGDDELGEYALGSALFRITGAYLASPPTFLVPPVPEIPEPKSKAPPTDAMKTASRQKYIDSAIKACTAPVDVSLELAGEEALSTESYLQYLSKHHMGVCTAVFDADTAASVPLIDDIRMHTELWTLNWTASHHTFLHRKELKRLSFALFSGPGELPAVLSKHGYPSMTGRVNLSAFSSAGVLEASLKCTLLAEDSSSVEVRLTAVFTSSPTPPPPEMLGIPAIRPADTLSLRQVAAPSLTIDVMQELRDEISSVIAFIAREYVTLYPLAPQEPGSVGPTSSEEGFSLQARKADFFHFLSSTAKYHALKESLKPKIQRAVRHRYGVRGRALNAGSDSVISSEGAERDDVPLDVLLQEVYVFLLRECNVVLNGLYASTLIDKDAHEVEQSARIDDEEETPAQAYQRLGELAGDLEADGRFDESEQAHLERVQMCGSSPVVGIDTDKVYAAYALYAEFLLRRAAKLRVALAAEDDAVLGLRRMAREALETAVSKSGKRRYWRYELLLACVLYEGDAAEAGDRAMNRALSAQLNGVPDETVLVEDLSGYDSEGLSSADPFLYAVLAGQQHRSRQPLRTRKTVRLISLSYATGQFSPAVSTHGAPRRTATLCLSRAAEYLFGFGFAALGGSCLALARECESAAITKAQLHSLPSNAPVFVRYAFIRAQAAGALCKGDVDEAIEIMNSSVLVADNADDKVRSLVWIGNAAGDFPLDSLSPSVATEALLKTIQLASAKLYSIPRDSYVRLGKLLLSADRFDEARQILVYGCRLYPSSATLFRLVGMVSLRLGHFDDCENALYESNLLDNRCPETWGAMSLLCLRAGLHRHKEADSALQQSIRLGLTSEDLMRELVDQNLAVNKLQRAEELSHRLATIERERYGEVRAETRKTLADVLVGLGEANEACEEYRAVVQNEGANNALRISAANKWLELLRASGRVGEEEAVREALRFIESATDARE